MGKAIAGALRRRGGVKIFAAKLNTAHIRVVQEIKKSDFVLLAVKPQDSQGAITQLQGNLNKKTILISIMAGVSIKKIVAFSRHPKIVRMMPNLGLSVGAGIGAWKKVGLNKRETEKTKKFMDKIMENFEVKTEDSVDKVTAISGSGPAYFLLLAAGLAEASQKLGLGVAESRKLVAKTLTATALLGKDGDYEKLIKKIASKGGTTEAALKVFQKKNFSKIVNDAVGAAYKRAKQLSQ